MFRILPVAFLLLASACSSDKKTGTFKKRAFYYWQTSLGAFDWRDSTYKAMSVSKIYLRVFDVDWSDESKAPVPVSPLHRGYNDLDSVEIVPVVFITNETFKNLDRGQSITLARQVHKKVMRITSGLLGPDEYDYIKDNWWEQNPYQVRSHRFDEIQRHDSAYMASMKQFREVQFDCDWTKSTKNNYFAFLEESQKLFGQQLVTSTVRLYQYKYPREAGLPPVKRGMLMCYNAGNVRDSKSVNSIFNKDEVMSYLEAGNYPIALDYALPVFDWALLYRQGELKAILSLATLKKEYADNVVVADESHLRVTYDFVYGHNSSSLLIRNGDEIRLEQPDMDEVKEVAAWLSAHKNNADAVLTFYHLNDHDFQEHSKKIEAIFNSF